MEYTSTGNLRKRGSSRIEQFLLLAICFVLLGGCANEPSIHPAPAPPATSGARASVDIYQLAQTEDEVAFLQIVQSQNPQWAADENNLRFALAYHRVKGHPIFPSSGHENSPPRLCCR